MIGGASRLSAGLTICRSGSPMHGPDCTPRVFGIIIQSKVGTSVAEVRLAGRVVAITLDEIVAIRNHWRHHRYRDDRCRQQCPHTSHFAKAVRRRPLAKTERDCNCALI
jgi:hypothetical protein